MAKFVIAGQADCPYYAKIELLGDKLAKNLPDFDLHKIVVQPNEWPSWLQNLCNERNWNHTKSPIVWRELLSRGGKGLLIGGANEFQEYVHGYYGIKSDFKSNDMTTIASENLQTKKEVDAEEAAFKALSNPLHVCITNASGGVAYGMINSIAKGECLGPDTEISLRLFDSGENMEQLKGVKMEAFDLAHPLLRKIQITSEQKDAFTDASAIILLDDIAQKEDESAEDWLKRNHELFVSYAKVIDTVAKKDVKVIVGGNGPVNFNALMMQLNMNNVPKENVVAVSRLVENRAKAIMSERLKVNSADVVDLIVWGNANGGNLIDVDQARVHNYDGAVWGPPSFSVPAVEMVHDNKWIAAEFLEQAANRKSKIAEALRHPAFTSHAAAVATVLQHWWQGSPPDQMFSLAVRSEGAYDIPNDLVCSVPVRFVDGGYTVVDNLELSDEKKEKLKSFVEELREETYAIFPRPKPPTPPPEPEPEQVMEKPPTDAEPVTNTEQAQDSEGGEASSDTTTEEGEKIEEGDEAHKPSMEKITEDKEGEEKEEVKEQE